MGRLPKPAALFVADNSVAHKTRAELDKKAAAEVHFAPGELRPPDYITGDPIALKKWTELMVWYGMAENKNLISESDTDIVAQYCATFSELKYLMGRQRRADSDDRVGYTTPILKTREMLTKLGSLIYLNPVAKVRGFSKKKEEQPVDPLAKFGMKLYGAS